MTNTAVKIGSEVLYLPVDAIKPNPYQPRKFFDRAQLEELAKSIRHYGVMRPISVRKMNECSYELVDGERRLRASKIIGLTNIPAILVDIHEQDSALLAIIENLQRQNLNFIEEAEGYRNLMEDYHFTQDELAEKLGKNQTVIASKLRILHLGKPLQKLLLDNDLTERYAQALLRLSREDEQLKLLNRIVEEGLTIQKTDELIDKMSWAKPREAHNIKGTIKDLRILTNTIDHAINLIKKSGLATNYIIEENKDGCEIKINIRWTP